MKPFISCNVLGLMLSILVLEACGKPEQKQSASKATAKAVIYDIEADETQSALTLRNLNDQIRIHKKTRAAKPLHTFTFVYLPFKILDFEIQQQSYEKCGRIGLETCRRWQTIKSLPTTRLYQSHMKAQIFVNGIERDPKYFVSPVKDENSEWIEKEQAMNSLLSPFANIFDEPLFSISNLYASASAHKYLNSQVRAFTSNGQLFLSPDLTSNSDQEIDVTLVITKSFESGIVEIEPSKFIIDLQ